MRHSRCCGLGLVAWTFLLCSQSLQTTSASEPANTDVGPFVFAYFNTGEEGQGLGLQYCYSRNGLEWTKLVSPSGAFLKPEVGGKLFRDPSIVQGPDGVFHMVWTTDWIKHGIGLSHSSDLLNWSEQEYLDVMKDAPTAANCWAPEIFYDSPSETYLIIWASTIPGTHPDQEPFGDDLPGGIKTAHRIYATTTKDFQTYTPSQLFYDDGYNVIDAFLVADTERSRYVMVLKDETLRPQPQKNLRLAFSKTPFSDWSTSTAPISPDWVEGAAVLKVGNEFFIYFDAYTRDRYEGLKTRDFENFESITDELKVPTGMRHGTPFLVSEAILQELLSQTAAESAGQVETMSPEVAPAEAS